MIPDTPNNPLIICGPTATGKTDLGLKLARIFNGEIVSADSRQVYRGMDVGTGKDLPKNAKSQMLNAKCKRQKNLKTKRLKNDETKYYLYDSVKVWGLDLVDPDEEFSVAQYLRITDKIIADIIKRKKLPIVVGGTGLYIKGIIEGIKTSVVPVNKMLRKYLENKNADELFEILKSLNPVKSANLNKSDKKNPRRLIRAIEIEKYSELFSHSEPRFAGEESQAPRFSGILKIGLNTNREILNERIRERVFKRLEDGFENEVGKLFQKGINWRHQSMQALGYRQYRNYLEGKIGRSEFIDLWTREEIKYAKRQMTWFKKDNEINWFDILAKNWDLEVEKRVRKWYANSS